MSEIAEIAVSGTAYSFDTLFSYRVPQKMKLRAGCRVLVPFGRSNGRRIGVVMNLRDGDVSGLKAVAAQVDSEPIISEELLGLAVYLREHTFCTYYDAVKIMLPPAMSVRAKERFSLPENPPEKDDLSDGAAALLGNIRLFENDYVLNDFIGSYIEAHGRLFVDELLDAEILRSDSEFSSRVGDLTAKMVRLSDDYIMSPENFRLTEKQKKAADFLSLYGDAPVKEVAYMCGFTPPVIERLVKSGAAEEYEVEIMRPVGSFPDERIDIADTVLSEEQQGAYDNIFNKIKEGKPSVSLLYGVTGSGKTSVFEKLIDSTVKIGRSVILLIPEISLTPQVLDRFRRLFGERVAIIHSGLTLGQRLDEYKRIKRGEADIVIGTRSAVFAPLENIGLIVIDEEGERTYKSEIPPRYSTHDVAKQRCLYNGGVLLLASATPSIESYYLAEKGIYNLVEIKKRYGSGVLPEVSIVDMKDERMAGNEEQFSRKLIGELRRNLMRGEQSIILLNRRGFYTLVLCNECRKPVYCEKCSVPMTFHMKNNRMMCHHCGFSRTVPDKCPFCENGTMKKMGFGTQRLEEDLKKFLPQAKILRMDADTVFMRDSYEKNFNSFRKGEYDIMIGTQMIGKGLDFPDVTLVGVLSVDSALCSGDFRSYERTFSLITQVVGRSGRREKKGRAILQTFMPDHYIMSLAAAQDYKGFYAQEIALRRFMIYPPVCDIFVFHVLSEDERRAKEGAYSVINLVNEKLNKVSPKIPVRVLGPFSPTYGRINGRYRWNIVVKSKNVREMRTIIGEILREGKKLREMKKNTLFVDVNGDMGV